MLNRQVALNNTVRKGIFFVFLRNMEVINSNYERNETKGKKAGTFIDKSQNQTKKKKKKRKETTVCFLYITKHKPYHLPKLYDGFLIA